MAVFYDLKPSLLAVAEAGLHAFARLITWQDVENSVEMGAVEQEYSISSHTILMSTTDTHACACVCKHVRTHTDEQTRKTREVEKICKLGLCV